MKNETNEVNLKIMTADFQILQAVSVWAKIEMLEGMSLVPETNQSERRHIMTEHLQIKGVKKGDAVIVCEDVWKDGGQGTLVNIPFASEGEIGVVVGMRDFTCRVKFCDGRRLNIDNIYLDRIVVIASKSIEDPDPQIDGIKVGRIAANIGFDPEAYATPEEIVANDAGQEEEFGNPDDRNMAAYERARKV